LFGLFRPLASWSSLSPVENCQGRLRRYQPIPHHSKNPFTSSTDSSPLSSEHKSSTSCRPGPRLPSSFLKRRELGCRKGMFRVRFGLGHCSFHTRNNRNESTVRSTQGRIFWYSIFEALAVCLMSLYVSSSYPTPHYLPIVPRHRELILDVLLNPQPSSLHPQDLLLSYREPVSRLSVGTLLYSMPTVRSPCSDEAIEGLRMGEEASLSAAGRYQS
jgi:hypothetical protein